MFVLLFYDKLTGFLGDGPAWFQQQTNPACDKYWWSNLLYINNFWPTGLGKEVSIDLLPVEKTRINFAIFCFDIYCF